MDLRPAVGLRAIWLSNVLIIMPKLFASPYLPEAQDADMFNDQAPVREAGPIGILLVNLGTPDEPTTFSMYISEHYRWPTSRLRRLTIRNHGFASMRAGGTRNTNRFSPWPASGTLYRDEAVKPPRSCTATWRATCCSPPASRPP